MILDTQEFPVPEKIELPEGFRLIRCDVEYVEKYCDLRNRAGWGAPGYTHEDFVKAWRKNLLETPLPRGLVVCEEVASGIAVAAATAEICSNPAMAVLGQVMSDPAFRGKGLGRAVCLEAMRVCVEQGFRFLYLDTDDFRLPALKIYLGSGWSPLLSDENAEEVWRKVCQELDLDYDSLKTYTQTPV